MIYLCDCKKYLMKKLLGNGLVIVLSFVAAHAGAQGFYFRAGLGYAFAQAGQTLDGTGQPYDGSLNNATQSATIKGASLSAGFQGQVGLGYMISDHAGIQLDANIGIA